MGASEELEHNISDTAVLDLFLEVKASLALACKKDPRTNEMLNVLHSVGHSGTEANDVTGYIPAHGDLLDCAISNLTDRKFFKLKTALTVAKHKLHWRVDDGGFYAKGADVGQGYKTGNMHTLLVGPKNSLFHADDFLLGFFLLAPNTLYRDHKHLAPEVYMPLTGPSGWRFGSGDWQDHAAGSVIYNAPNVVHATRVYAVPFLSVFVWAQDINAPCSVVFADDWEKIEAALHNSSK
ncbi:dimethylsulfonioproprionate lyase family protein [Roseovarius sp. EL26]|uniref:dimethylsulfonioproprionate lyase family protein n=1 Tax=Roseovarius sp. EL26 TaxID=2126672 RepID=UPI000EA0479C|nr:dimethylsulfonioproprionate lyase family protein [Roseovarius sp. EL26]